MEKKKRQNRKREERKVTFDADSWKPKTELGIKVKSGEIKNLDELLDSGLRILEPEIVDFFLPTLEVEMISIGQSKGKFGGGKRSIWRQTQKKTREGNKPKFASVVAVGNREGFIGIGFGKAKETVPARDKATRKAKLNIINIRRGCGSWECACGENHSVPFKARGKVGSVIVTLLPAPKGTGLCSERESKKLFALAGIKDIYSKAKGKTATKINVIYACFEALKNLKAIKVPVDFHKVIEEKKK